MRINSVVGSLVVILLPVVAFRLFQAQSDLSMHSFVPVQVIIGGKARQSMISHDKKNPTGSVIPDSIPVPDRGDAAANIAPDAPPSSGSGSHKSIKTTGMRANMNWRAVPMEDVRLHPLFTPLPHPSAILVSNTRDFGRFRQDSWQWDALHQGRLTTSKLACVLGLYEAAAGAYLNVPSRLQSHERALGAWHHLKQRSPDHWGHLNNGYDEKLAGKSDQSWPPSSSIWSTGSGPFPATYNPLSHVYFSLCPVFTRSSASSCRLAWGSAQEATALLAVLNHFAETEPETTLCESGMCCFESVDCILHIPTDVLSRRTEDLYFETYCRIYLEQSLPLLGASPDGLLRHPDGSLEVVEIKCYSPFASKADQTGLVVSYHRPENTGVPVWHVPQLQLEMFCAGPLCTSAVMAVLYVDGVKIFRMMRDDEYIASMLNWVQRFVTTYLRGPSNKLKPPDQNFFNPRSDPQYRAFLNRTEELARGVTFLAEKHGDEVQRSPLNAEFFVS